MIFFLRNRLDGFRLITRPCARITVAFFVALFFTGLGNPVVFAAEEGGIFNRFSSEQQTTNTRQAFFAFPVTIRPQTDPNAEITRNQGIYYRNVLFPGNRIFLSLSYQYSVAQWEPSDPNLEEITVYQFDFTPQLNFDLSGWIVLGFGFGLGVMDGLVKHRDGSITHRIGPYLPFQLGFTLPMGENLSLGYLFSVTPFWGKGPVLSHNRSLLGIGFNY